MREATVVSDNVAASTHAEGHRRWVRISHWTIVASFVTLGITGVFILAVHPRLYWGEVGNDLLPAILEFPLSNNHRPDEYQAGVAFSNLQHAPLSANRMYPIFNQNGWGRSLHFLAAWFLVVTGLFYIVAGMFSGHIRRDLLPRARELAPQSLWLDFVAHLRRQPGAAQGGPPYGLLQKCAYVSVVFVALPLMLVTGLTMSPAVTAAYPMLLDLFGGYQSARTIHFFCFSALVLFLVIHVAMVVMTGFRRQLRAMALGK